MRRLSFKLIALICTLFVAFTACQKEADLIVENNGSVAAASDKPNARIATRQVNVNLYGGANAYSSTAWNNWNSSKSLNSGELKYSDGSVSTISLALSYQQQIADNGTAFNTTSAPKEVMRYTSYSNKERTLSIKGLNDAATYTFNFYGARTGATNNYTEYTIGTTKKTLLTDNNVDKYITFTNIKSTNGVVEVKINKTYNYNYLSAVTIVETGETSDATNPLPEAGGGRVHVLQKTNGIDIYMPDASSQPWQPGDTLVITAGSYKVISLGNFKGTAAKPIIIINKGGQVKAEQIRFNNDAAYFKLLGTGAPGVKYGFYLNSNKNSGVAMGIVHDVEVSNVEITNAGVGIFFKINPVAGNSKTIYPNYVLKNGKIHDNYIHNTYGEGMYIGHTAPNSDPNNGGYTPVRMENIHIYNNILDGMDWDGIQLSNARGNAKIYNNKVSNFGRINRYAQNAGIILGGNTNGEITNNIVKTGSGNGIQAFGYGTITISGNTIENVGRNATTSGVESIFTNDILNAVETNPKQQIVIKNNIIKNPMAKGAIRVGAYNKYSLPSVITGNTLYIPNAASNWMTYHLVSHVAGSTITNNTLIK